MTTMASFYFNRGATSHVQKSISKKHIIQHAWSKIKDYGGSGTGNYSLCFSSKWAERDRETDRDRQRQRQTDRQREITEYGGRGVWNELRIILVKKKWLWLCKEKKSMKWPSKKKEKWMNFWWKIMESYENWKIHIWKIHSAKNEHSTLIISQVWKGGIPV